MNFKPKTSASRNDVGVGDASSDMDNSVVLVLVGEFVVAPDDDEGVVAVVVDDGLLEGLEGDVVPINDEPWIKAWRLFVVVAVGRKARDTGNRCSCTSSSNNRSINMALLVTALMDICCSSRERWPNGYTREQRVYKVDNNKQQQQQHCDT
jgi:hypothetical protein